MVNIRTTIILCAGGSKEADVIKFVLRFCCNLIFTLWLELFSYILGVVKNIQCLEYKLLYWFAEKIFI